MPSTPVIYGLDIETDTSTGGLDPRASRVLCVGVATAGGEVVVADADEAALLAALDELLAELGPGVVATWNGAAFDLPFLATRAWRHGLGWGLRLLLDPGLELRGDPLPGHEGAYRGGWHGHRHLDAYRVFRADPDRLPDQSCSLKAVARRAGLGPVEADAARVHELADEVLHRYVASDARCTRQLALAAWERAAGWVDPVVASPLGAR